MARPASVFAFFFSFVFIAMLIGGAFAASSGALYNFGSMQEGTVFNAQPGDAINISLYFFVDEEYGTRITHIRVSPEILPQGWEITFSPPLHTEYVNVSGVIVTSEENIYVEPRPVLAEKPAKPEEGIFYLISPSGKGYLQAKRVVASVKIPKNVPLGKSFDVKLMAEAFWFGPAGNIALEQTRSFNYVINTVQKEYSEKVITASSEEKQVQDNTVFYLLITVIVIAIVAAYLYLGKKKRKAS